MSAYADLAKIVIGLLLAIGLVLFGRSCGKAAGELEGEAARQSLQRALDQSNRDLSYCSASIQMANNVADQAAAEAIRQQHAAEQAAARAAQVEKESAARIANLSRQLANARNTPEAAAQLDMELHPAIPLR